MFVLILGDVGNQIGLNKESKTERVDFSHNFVLAPFMVLFNPKAHSFVSKRGLGTLSLPVLWRTPKTVHVKPLLFIWRPSFTFRGGGGGGQAYHFGRNDFELGVEGPGHVLTFWGWFWVHACNTAHCCLKSKNRAKTKIWTKSIGLSYCPHSICLLKNEHLVKMGWKMTWHLAFFPPILANFFWYQEKHKTQEKHTILLSFQ